MEFYYSGSMLYASYCACQQHVSGLLGPLLLPRVSSKGERDRERERERERERDERERERARARGRASEFTFFSKLNTTHKSHNEGYSEVNGRDCMKESARARLGFLNF